MEKLKLEHLSAYLPYGLKGMEYENGELFILMQIDLTKKYPIIWESNLNLNRTRTDCKPILRPLSDLDEEIVFNRDIFIPIDFLDNKYPTLGLDKECEKLLEMDGSRWINSMSYLLIQHLLEWHFDVFNLIEKGLAIDINTIKP